jgi:hypothetical protein
MADAGVNTTDIVTLAALMMVWLNRIAGMLVPMNPSTISGKMPEFPFANNTPSLSTMADATFVNAAANEDAVRTVPGSVNTI